MALEFDSNKFTDGLKHQLEINDWLNGNGPYTEEEENIRKRFGGKNADMMAKLAISFYRKAQAVDGLSGNGNLSEEEQKIIDSMSGNNQELTGRLAVGFQRKSRLIKYLGGDEKEDLSK